MWKPSVVAVALAGFIGLAAYNSDTSAHGGYENWYQTYERHREARERYRARQEERAYKRHMAYQENLAKQRSARQRYREANERRWVYAAHSLYRSYERYCDCPHYREYAHHPYIYGYSYGHPYIGAYAHYETRWWRGAHYIGSKRWWKRMDRDGRGGRN